MSVTLQMGQVERVVVAFEKLCNAVARTASGGENMTSEQKRIDRGEMIEWVKRIMESMKELPEPDQREIVATLAVLYRVTDKDWRERQ